MSAADSLGRSLELYFIDGKPDGMLTAEVFNWTGHVLRIPRVRLSEGLKRPEAKQTGVYLLLGDTEDSPLAYVGETENMADRLRSHAREKDWWDNAILITTTGDLLHKAHVKYLESRIVELAQEAANIPLENGNLPPRASLNEAARANMESFLDTLQMVLPAIRVDLIQSAKRTPSQVRPGSEAAPVIFEISAPRRNIHATARLVGGELILQAGSKITASWTGPAKWHQSFQKKHAEIIGAPATQVEGDIATLGEDYAFSSPSTAACIVLGRSSNGRKEWRLQPDGRTYAAYEEAQLNAVDAA